jgi:hypothetical protein
MSSRIWVDEAWQDLGANVARAANGGFPDDTNSGHLNEPDYPGFLTPFLSTVIESDTTYMYRDFPAVSIGTIPLPVENVTFVGCRFRATSPENALTILYGTNIQFRYCTFQPAVEGWPVSYEDSYQYGIAAGGSYSTFVEGLTVEYCDIWGFGNAIDSYGSTEAQPHVFRHNWIHDAADDGGSYHTDGIGSLSSSGTLLGTHVVVHHNTIEAVGNTNGLAYQAGIYENFTVTENLFGGFGFCVALWAALGGGPHTFTDNVFSTRLPVIYGPLYNQAFWELEGSVWARNRWRVPAGAAWGDPANNGKFWIPNAIDSPDDDSPYVSDTDYEA